MEEEQKKEGNPSTSSGDMADELEKCQAQAEEYLAGWKRAKADLVNSQKDEAKRFEEVIKFANKEFMKDAIVVLDSFDLALSAEASAKEDRVYKGMIIIKNQLADVLKKHGLEQIKVSAGMPFDAVYHEALMEISSESPPGTIVEEIEKGYTLHGRVVRPSRVKISKDKQD